MVDILTVAVGCVVAAACGSAATDPASSGASGTIVADVARVDPDPGAASTSGRATRAFGADLYAAVSDEPGNLAISPYSVAAALSMTSMGAAGATAEEMDAVLHVADTAAAGGFGSLDAALAMRAGTIDVPGGEPLDVELSFGNALWPQLGFPFEAAFLESMARYFGAGVHPVDYVDDSEGARRSINEWVADTTRSRIPELIGPGVLSASTRLVLTNALYLNAPWDHPFVEGATVGGPFGRADGSTVTAEFMTLQESLNRAAGDGWQSVELPYLGGELAMIVLVPDAGRFDEVEQGLDADFVEAVGAAVISEPVVLRLPRWEYRTQVMLKEQLSELGMPMAFTPAADFSAMSSEPLFVSDVIHEVFISVDEKGTEAAAATAVVMAETAAPVEPFELTVDRPFIYWVVDVATDAVLLLGRVLDPTAA